MALSMCAIVDQDTGHRLHDHYCDENAGRTHFHITSLRLKTGLAEMLEGGVIMDVMFAAQAEVAEKAGGLRGIVERPPEIRHVGGHHLHLVRVRRCHGEAGECEGGRDKC